MPQSYAHVPSHAGMLDDAASTPSVWRAGDRRAEPHGAPMQPSASADSKSGVARMGVSGAAAGSLAAHDHRTQLRVRNLPYNVRWQDLKDLFRRAGTVLRADVHLTPENRSRGMGSVLFAAEEDALRALAMLDGYSWQGCVLDVQLEHEHVYVNGKRLAPELDGTRAAPQPRAPGLPPSGALSGVGNDLMYMPPAESLPMHWPLPPAPHYPPSYTGGAARAPAPSSVPSAPLPYPGRVLFIGNLPFHCQWQDLKDLFRAAGNIQRADVALNAEGRSRGFGTVLFASPEDAQNAVRLYHGYEFSGRTLKVHFDRLALFGPASSSVPADPSQYTAAFNANASQQQGTASASMMPGAAPRSLAAALDEGRAQARYAAADAQADTAHAPILAASSLLGEDVPEDTSLTTQPEAASAAAAEAQPRDARSSGADGASGPSESRPAHIPMPPSNLPMSLFGSSFTPSSTVAGASITPGMPYYMLGNPSEPSPQYPAYMSPGIVPPLTPGVVHDSPNMFAPHMNAAPGSAVSGGGSGPQAPPAYAPSMQYMDFGTPQQQPMFMTPFTPMGALPPTPHWSQPVGHAPPVPEDAASTPQRAVHRGDAARAPVGTKRAPAGRPPSATQATNDGYPFPALAEGDQQGDSAEHASAASGASDSGAQSTSTSEPTVQDSTAELTSVIARMSVRGSARSQRHKGSTSPERSTAANALSRLRENLTTPAPRDTLTKRSSQSLSRSQSKEGGDAA